MEPTAKAGHIPSNGIIHTWTGSAATTAAECKALLAVDAKDFVTQSDVTGVRPLCASGSHSMRRFGRNYDTTPKPGSCRLYHTQTTRPRAPPPCNGEELEIWVCCP